jgi:hypothetical protein
MIRLADPSTPPGQPVPADALRRMVEQALPAARARAILAESIRDALDADDTATALRLMREYVGLPPAK